MATTKRFCPFVLFMSAILLASAAFSVADEASESTTYIVYVHPEEVKSLQPFNNVDARRDWYASFVATSIGSAQVDAEEAQSRLLYVYDHVMTGFAARLTTTELEAMRNVQGFVGAIPDLLLPLHTTYSSQFVGLDPQKGVWPQTQFGKGIIIGVVDSGVWPESASFSDQGIPPPPKSWKGVCQTAADFNSSHCNNKIIGARVFNKAAKILQLGNDVDTPRDAQGHGTHTAATAAGNSAPNAEIFGYANGTARGMAPSAHLAIYKVCFGAPGLGGCVYSDVLAGIDQAVADGVDVISLSIGIGVDGVTSLDLNPLAVAAYQAVQKGIFVSSSAGNNGPTPSTVDNDAPWMMTVGATTMDRALLANVKLGDGSVVHGESLNPPQGGKSEELRLVMAFPDPFCTGRGSLSPRNVSGKLVICKRSIQDGPEHRIKKGLLVGDAGGKGMILMNDADTAEDVVPDAHFLPTAHLGFKAGDTVMAYLMATKKPTAIIQSNGSVFGAKIPSVALFSSRGPSGARTGVLKPDVIAPGVAILAAWPSDLGPAQLAEDGRRVMFNTMSGTSMSCPHVSGIVALIKSAHPDWSPAAIKSALITTAQIVDRNGQSIMDAATGAKADILATGAGHVNVEKASDPGLIYDILPQDYIPYLCGLNYTSAQIGIIVKKNVTCPPSSDESTVVGNLNYPSLTVNVTAVPFSATLRRTVTNVGPAKSTYRVKVVPPKGVEVTVDPTTLSFSAAMEKKSYNVTFVVRSGGVLVQYPEQGITWVSVSSAHQVRSPISILWN